MFNKITTKIAPIIAHINTHADFKKMSGKSVGVLCTKIIGALLAFLVQIPITRTLGTEQYGLYIYILSWVMVMGVIVPLGMHTTAVKFFPDYKTRKSWGDLKGLCVFLSIVAIGMVGVVAIIITAIFELFDLKDIQIYDHLPTAGFLLLGFSLAYMAISCLRSLKHVMFAEVTETIARPIAILLLFLLFYQISPTSETHNALLANNIAVFGMFFVLFIYLCRKIPKEIFAVKARFNDYKLWFALGLPMMLMSGMNYLLNRTDIIMLGTIGDISEAGLYGISSRVSELVTFGQIAVHTILVPMISESWQKGEREHTQKLLTMAAWFIFAFSVAAAIVLVVCGPFLLPVFGEEFAASYKPLLILLVARAAPTIVGPVVFLMALMDQQKLAAKILFVTVGLNILGNWLLIPEYGMMGAAVSTTIGFLFWNITIFLIVIKKMKINPSILPIKIGSCRKV